MAGGRGTQPYSFELVPDDGDHAPDGELGLGPETEAPPPTPTEMLGRAVARLRQVPRQRVLIASAIVCALVIGVGAAQAVRERQRIDQVVAAPGGVRSLAEKPTELWSVDIDGGVAAVLTGGLVAVRNGTKILGIDVATGRELWQVDVGGQANCGPTPWSPAEWARPLSRLVCVSGPDEARTVTVVDSTGVVVARRELPPIETQEREPDESGITFQTPSRYVVPAADGGLLVVERTGPRPASRTFTTEDKAYRAMEEGLDRGQGAVVRMEDAATGTVRWEQRMPFEPVTTLQECASLNMPGDVYVLETEYTQVTSSPSHVVVSGCGVGAAFTPDGRSVGDAPADVPWTFVEMNPYVDGGYVVSANSMSHALLDDAGRQVVKLPGNLLNPWATDGTGDETLLVTAGASELLAVDRSGRELWSRDFVAGVSFALVRADGVAVIADALGGVSAVELETGQERWAIEAGELVPNIDPWLGARFAATDGRLALLAVGTLEDAGMRLVTLDLRSGRVVWEAQRGGDEPVELVAAGGALLERVSSGRSTSEVALDGTTVLIDGTTLSRLAGK